MEQDKQLLNSLRQFISRTGGKKVSRTFKYQIYCLFDPDFPEIPKYVGQTRRYYLCERLNHHVQQTKTDTTRNSKKNIWIRELVKAGRRPGIRLLEWTDDKKREIWWITELRSKGFDLLNSRDWVGWKVPREHINKRSATIVSRRTNYCPKGHEYTPENTYLLPRNGNRSCMTCRKENKRNFDDKRRAERKT